jgi:hypothetical protein
MRCTNAFLLVALAAVCACCSAPEPLGISTRVADKCTDAELDHRFFRGVFSGKNELNLTNARGLSELLVSFGEPSLSCDVDADEAYRVLYLPEDGDALTIRIERLEETYTVRVTSKPTADAAPRSREHAITPQAWEKVTRAIDGYNFWSRSPYPSPSTIPSGVIVLHGAAWLLEGQRDRSYHAVSRVSASNEADFDLPARALFEIAGLQAPGEIKPRP